MKAPISVKAVLTSLSQAMTSGHRSACMDWLPHCNQAEEYTELIL